MPVPLFIVNVEVAIVRDGRYLATTRAAAEEYGAGWVGFPGGKLESDLPEPCALEETARREAWEEVRVRLLDPIVYVESHIFMIDNQPVLDVVMLARATSDSVPMAEPSEVAHLEWLSFESLMQHAGVQAWTRESLLLVEQERARRDW